MSTALLTRIAEKCSEFETLVSRGQSVDIESFISDIETHEREFVRRELEELAQELGQPMGPRTTDRLGTEVQRFELKEPLQAGGMGQVWVAIDTQFGRRVALKEPSAEYKDDPVSRALFLREAEITAKLDHPGIVPIYNLSHHPDGRPYYTMRLISGGNAGTLYDLISAHHKKSGATPWELEHSMGQLIQQLIKVANTIAYAHSQGVVHRDIKPSNILTGQFGETLVVDWGLAVELHRQECGLSTIGPPSEAAAPTLLLGTIGYSAPEQLSPTSTLSDVKPACDIYSLGAVLYHILAGRPAISRDEYHTIPELLGAVREGKYSAPHVFRRSVPRGLEAICLKAMSKDPADRYGSAEAFAKDLQYYLADLPVSAVPDTLLTGTARWLRHHRAVFQALLVTLFAALGALGVIGLVQSMHNRELQHNQSQLIEEVELKEWALIEANKQRSRAVARETLAVDALASFPETLLQEHGLKYAETYEAKKLREQLLSKSIEFYKRTLFEINTETDLADSNRDKLVGLTQTIGGLYRELGDFTMSISCYRDAGSLMRPAMPPLPPWTGKKEWWVTDKQAENAVRFVANSNALLTTFRAARMFEEANKEFEDVKPWIPLLETMEIAPTKARLTLSDLYWQHATTQSQLGETVGAKESFQKALEYSKQAQGFVEIIKSNEPQVSPNDVLKHLQRVQLDYATFITSRGERDEGLAIFASLIQSLKDRLAQDEVSDVDDLFTLSLAYQNQANNLLGPNWLKDFLEINHKALSIRRDLVRRFPSNRSFFNLLRYSLTVTADAEARNGRFEEALRLSEEASALGEKLHIENPEDRIAVWELGSILHQQGMILSQLSRIPQARAAFLKAFPLIQDRCESDDSDLRWVKRLLECSVYAGEKAIRQGNLTEAAVVYSKMLSYLTETGNGRETPIGQETWAPRLLSVALRNYTLILEAQGRQSEAGFWMKRLLDMADPSAVETLDRRMSEIRDLGMEELIQLSQMAEQLQRSEQALLIYEEIFSRDESERLMVFPPVVAMAVQQALRASLRDSSHAIERRQLALEWLRSHVLLWPLRPMDPDSVYRDVLNHWSEEVVLGWTRIKDGPFKMSEKEFEAWEAIWRGLERRYPVKDLK
jgi:serine/threonine protein kinase